MKLRILTLDSTLFSGEVTSVTLPGTMGSFQVLRNHAPLISSLTEGPLIYVSDGNVKKMTINGGLVEVQDNTISVYLE